MWPDVFQAQVLKCTVTKHFSHWVQSKSKILCRIQAQFRGRKKTKKTTTNHEVNESPGKTLGVTPNNGTACSKQSLKEVQIQNAHSRGSYTVDPPERLALCGRSLACLLSYKHLPRAQEISHSLVLEQSKPICHSSIRAQPSSAGVQGA